MFDAEKERMENEGEEEGTERIPLLDSGRARDAGGAEKEVGVVRVARFRPRRRLGAVTPNFSQHGFPADAVKSIREVQLKDPFPLHWNGVVVEYGTGGVNDGLSATLDADAELKRREVLRCVGRRFLRHAF